MRYTTMRLHACCMTQAYNASARVLHDAGVQAYPESKELHAYIVYVWCDALRRMFTCVLKTMCLNDSLIVF